MHQQYYLNQWALDMRVNQIELENFRSFKSVKLDDLGDINILIGENNSGKSSIMRAIRYLQDGVLNVAKDVRGGAKTASVLIGINSDGLNRYAKGIEVLKHLYTLESEDRKNGVVGAVLLSSDGAEIAKNQQGIVTNHLSYTYESKEPNHMIVPFLSKRKTAGFSSKNSFVETSSISDTAMYLGAKVSRVSVPTYPGHALYRDACKNILGIVIASTPDEAGQTPGMYLPDTSAISIEQMGDGVASILYLLTQLIGSRRKVFVIEELENDLHPTALKSLLDLIVKSAEENQNQFFISTHSNIVVTHLAHLEGSKLFRVVSEKGADIPTSTIEEVPATPHARIEVLQELGYALSDFQLYEGWLIFEEASAELICRDYLIPWFAPKLKKLRTISAAGVDRVKLIYDDVLRLVLFTHLLPTYAGRVWVLVDGDKAGKDAVTKLRNAFTKASANQFTSFDEENFEKYYPANFEEEITAALGKVDLKQRRTEKDVLFKNVKKWIEDDKDRAKDAFKESAKDVIDKLQTIEVAFSKDLEKLDPN